MPIRTLFTSMPKWVYWVAILVIVAASFIIFYIFWTLWFPPSTFSTDQPYKIITPVIKQGSMVRYEARICTEKEQNFINGRQILNVDTGTLYDISDIITYYPIGCYTKTLEADTPVTAPAGRYRIIDQISLPINSFQEERHQFESEVFNISQLGVIR